MQCRPMHNVMLFCMLLLFDGGKGQDCYGERHVNGTITFHINETVPESSEYYWSVKECVQANGYTYNITTVQSRGPRFVTFNSCYENVSYWNPHCLKSINCPFNCSSNPPSQDQLTQILRLVAGFVVLGILAVLGYVLFWKRNTLQQWLKIREMPGADNTTAEQVRNPESQALQKVTPE